MLGDCGCDVTLRSPTLRKKAELVISTKAVSTQNKIKYSITTCPEGFTKDSLIHLLKNFFKLIINLIKKLPDCLFN